MLPIISTFQLIREELERCDEVMDKDFYIIDALTIVEYLEGECVPCEIGVVKCSIRDGIIQHQHFFPDPGPLRFLKFTVFVFIIF